MTNTIYHHVASKGSLKRRLWLCWKILNFKPVMYRVGIEGGRVFLPSPLHVESVHLIQNNIYQVDDEGRPMDNGDYTLLGGEPVPLDKWS